MGVMLVYFHKNANNWHTALINIQSKATDENAVQRYSNAGQKCRQKQNIGCSYELSNDLEKQLNSGEITQIKNTQKRA